MKDRQTILHSITDIMAAAVDVMDTKKDKDRVEDSISRILSVPHPRCRESSALPRLKRLLTKISPSPIPRLHYGTEHRMKNLIIRRIIPIAALALIIASCSSKSTIEGTYSQAGSGMEIVLDLMSGDKAILSMSGEDFACTYKVNDDKLALDCSPKGEKLDFTIHDDGTLIGPGLVGILKKQK
jgi:hypothetical protein